MSKNLREKLEEYARSDYYPFHMPGHKRNTDLLKMDNPYGLDITEIDGFDNLHMPEGVLRGIMEYAADIYGASRSYLQINGSTGGILAGIASCVRHGDKVIIARNCHRSVYHAVYLHALKPAYIYPHEDKKWGISCGILKEDVDKVLQDNQDAKLVVITSPTYEGIVSDIEGIVQSAHAYGIPLMVDEAHGAHFGFHPYFPQNSVRKGADIVIHSLHKTLPAFTQSALLHVQGNLVSPEKIGGLSAAYQTSSPSYLLMAGIEKSLHLVCERKDLLEEWKNSLEYFYQEALNLKKIQVMKWDCDRKDSSKIILSVKNTSMTGTVFYDILRETYHLQMEAVFADYVIAMTSMADKREGFLQLLTALREIDTRIEAREQKMAPERSLPYCIQKLTPYEAELREERCVLLKNSVGEISKETLFLYPPGIPILVPGEIITEEVVGLIEYYKERGLIIRGCNDKNAEYILVTREH